MSEPSSAERRRFLSGALATVGGLALASCGNQSDGASKPKEAPWGGDLVDPPLDKPDVTLTTMNGKPFPFRTATRDRLTLLYFGYTSCPDQCPIWLNTVARARQLVTGPGSRPLVLFVGVDAKRDTPAQLRKYLGAIDDTFVGLTGSESTIAAANKAPHFPPIEIGPADASGQYMVGHHSKAVAFSPDNTGHRLYGFDTRVKQLAADLPRLAAGEFR